MSTCCTGSNAPLGGTPPETPACCPSRFCDDRLLGLPSRNSIKLLGTEGKCLVQFPKDRAGAVIVDQYGNAMVTNRPKVELPYLKQFVLEDGHPIQNPSGTGFVEDIPPPFDSLVVSTCEGYQNRSQGTSGQKQRVMWDGCKFVYVADSDELTLEDFQYVGATRGFCDTFELCLVDMGDGTVKLGYRAKPTLLVGTLHMFGGPKNKVTAGWIVCEGQELDKVLYPDLFTCWGYGWGGAGAKFRAPKPDGRYPRFVDQGAGVDPNAASRTALFTGGNTGDNVGSYGKGANATTDAYDFGVYMIAFAGCVKTES